MIRRVMALGALVLCSSLLDAQDTLRVRADNPPEWGPSARLLHQFTIGELDGPPEYAFGRIYQAAVEDYGAFYLYDDNDAQIRRYDASGVFVRRIGRYGGGPGEYQAVGGMQVTRDGLLVVYDGKSRRLTYFQPDGKVRREITILRGFDWGGWAIDSAGTHYLPVRLPGPLEGPASRRQYVRFSTAGAVVDSIPHPPSIEPVGTGFCLQAVPNIMRCSFFSSTIVRPYLFGGMVTAAESHTYRFDVVNPGRPVRRVERAHRAASLGREERAEWLSEAENWPVRPKGALRFEVPRVKPAIRDLFSDDQGRIWVNVFVDAEKRTNPPPRRSKRPPMVWWERTTFDVFSPSGRYLARLQLPWETRILAVRRNRVLMLTRGVDGEDRVGMYHMPSVPAK